MRAPSSGCGNTQSLTVSSFSISAPTELSVVARESAMSITTVTVPKEVFLAERRAKTFRRMSHSGWFSLCLAKRGKYLNHTVNIRGTLIIIFGRNKNGGCCVQV